jgi:hypothetical protein
VVLCRSLLWQDCQTGATAGQECLLVAKVLESTWVDADSNGLVDENIPGDGVLFEEGPICIPSYIPGDVRTT